MIEKPDDIEYLKKSGSILAQSLKAVSRAVVSGMTTIELNELAERMIRKLGGEPAFLGYRGYKHALCTSINDEIVHVPPSEDVVVMDGDIISLDMGVKYNNWNSDMAVTIIVGDVPKEVQRLVRVTQEALDLGIKQAKPGNRIGDISHAIQSAVEKKGFSLIRTLFGHGIGKTIHESPQIPNIGKAGTGDRIVPGMVLAIEPISAVSTSDSKTLDDGWTVSTADKSLSAHFEHTVLVTEQGPEIITKT